MKIDIQNLFKIEYTIRVIPEHYHIVSLDIVAGNLLDAFAIGKEVLKSIYEYSDDVIECSSLVDHSTIYSVK